MCKAHGWRTGTRYCTATNRDGTPGGNLVATTPSGVAIYRRELDEDGDGGIKRQEIDDFNRHGREDEIREAAAESARLGGP